VPDKSNIYTVQLDDSEIQPDFIEVWERIEESIRIFELTSEKQDHPAPGKL
jgi:hypothetical protein